MGTRTALFSRQQPGGVFDITDLEKHPGDVWFVHSGTGTDGAGYGQNPDAPVATLDYAVGLCTASKGDAIYVLPGHAETISTAALSPTLDKVGVQVIGLGTGALRPTFTFTHADASLIVASASCPVRNLLLVNGVASQVAVVDVNAKDFVIENCEIRAGAATQFLTAIDLNGGGANATDRCVIRNCKIISEAAGATQAIEIGRVHDAVVIDGNWITGDYSVAGIHSNSICTNMLVRANIVRNVNAADWAIELSAAEGVATGNRLYSDGAATCLNPGSLMCTDNLMVNAINESGIPVPVAASGTMPAGAIGAASFAAGAINAAAIANDAIDATAIADGAIDAATFAANAIAAAGIAADAITNAKIADNALASEQFALSAGERTTDGVVVTRTTGTLPQGTAAAIFTVTGHCLLRRILGVVTTQIGAVANVAHLRLNSTGAGATTDICLAAGGNDITGDAVDTTYEITGTVGEALVATTNLPKAKSQLLDLMLVPGNLELACAGSSGTGSIRWSVTYVPMEAGAQMVAV